MGGILNITNDAYSNNGWLHIHAAVLGNSPRKDLEKQKEISDRLKLEAGKLECIADERVQEITPIEALYSAENVQKYIEEREHFSRLEKQYNFRQRNEAIQAYKKNLNEDCTDTRQYE